MHDLSRRIKGLESRTVGLRRSHQRRIESVLSTLSLQHLESLISAFGADGQNRTLTEEETVARQAYRSAMERERLGTRPLVAWEVIPDFDVIRRTLVIALAQRFSGVELRLVRAALEARQQRREPTKDESVALEACNAYFKKLSLTASGLSRVELERVHGGAE
jgi:hypothetical protein